jgi:hypothetical protein
MKLTQEQIEAYETNSVDNAITRLKRPDFIVHRDFTPIESLDDHCLDCVNQAVAW